MVIIYEPKFPMDVKIDTLTVSPGKRKSSVKKGGGGGDKEWDILAQYVGKSGTLRVTEKWTQKLSLYSRDTTRLLIISLVSYFKIL